MNVKFYKYFREYLGDHLFSAINYFFVNVVMPQTWGKTYIILIPKNEHPKFANDYHPISLFNVSYKIITKILANHLKNVIDSLVDKE